MEKCYTIREFLLSLRNEYLQNQKALNHLKNYIMIMNKKVENFRLSIGEEEIIVYIKRREITLDRILNRCLKKNNKEIKELIYNSEEFLSLKNLRIYPSEISTFEKEVKLILETPFVQKATLNSVSFKTEDYSINFGINIEGIKIYESKYEKFDSMLEYNAFKDILSINRFNKEFSNTDIDELLDIKIPSTVLQNYHKELLEQLESKPLRTSEFEPFKKADFKFEEYTTKLSLVKVKK